MLDDWVTKLSQDLGVKSDDVAISEILDLARDAERAHDTIPRLIVANWAEARL